jgi:hypothetical protein
MKVRMLKAKLQQSEEALRASKELVDKANAISESANNHYRDAMATITRLQRELLVKQQASENSRAKIADLRKKLAEAELREGDKRKAVKELKELEQSRIDIVGQLASTKAQLATAQSLKAECEGEARSILAQLREAEVELPRLKKEAATSQQRLVESEKLLEKLDEEIAAAKRENMKLQVVGEQFKTLVLKKRDELHRTCGLLAKISESLQGASNSTSTYGKQARDLLEKLGSCSPTGSVKSCGETCDNQDQAPDFDAPEDDAPSCAPTPREAPPPSTPASKVAENARSTSPAKARAGKKRSSSEQPEIVVESPCPPKKMPRARYSDSCETPPCAQRPRSSSPKAASHQDSDSDDYFDMTSCLPRTRKANAATAATSAPEKKRAPSTKTRAGYQECRPNSGTLETIWGEIAVPLSEEGEADLIEKLQASFAESTRNEVMESIREWIASGFPPNAKLGSTKYNQDKTVPTYLGVKCSWCNQTHFAVSMYTEDDHEGWRWNVSGLHIPNSKRN